MPLRLSIIAPLPPCRGGISQFATCSWEALAIAGHEVQAISFRRLYPGRFFGGKGRIDSSPARTPGRVFLDIDPLGPWTWGPTAKRIVEFGPDILFFHHSSPVLAPACGMILRRVRKNLPGVKSIALVHDAVPHERRLLDKRINRLFLGNNDGYIVLSQDVEKDLWLLGLRQPVRRIHHPIYDQFGPAPSRAAARERLGISPDTPLILFFGYVRPYKGLEILLEAVAETRVHLPELRLIVAGEFCESESKYLKLIAHLGIARAVDVRNEYLPDAEVAILFAACDLVVQPYVAATQSGVAQVAFHFERPMILTDVGGLSEIVDDGRAGLVVPPRDPDALAHAIERFFTQQLAASLTEGVRARKAEFSWSRLVDAVEDLAGEDR